MWFPFVAAILVLPSGVQMFDAIDEQMRQIATLVGDPIPCLSKIHHLHDVVFPSGSVLGTSCIPAFPALSGWNKQPGNVFTADRITAIMPGIT
jgi:hypothetical protein